VKNKHILSAVIALLTLIMVVATSSVQSSQQINQIYVFGDSLSDVGNVFRSTGGVYPPNPPYFQGRYSNGRVWVEYLSEKLALNPKQTTNFAYGGAMTGRISNNGIPGLLTQVENFTKSQKDINQNALYVIWSGANDYIYGAADSATPVKNISVSIDLLASSGAKKILVANLPDLGNLPATRNNPSSQALSTLTNAHNQGFDKALVGLRQKFDTIQIGEVNVNFLYRDAIFNSGKYGFTNVTSACLYNKATCDNPDKFLFWDGIHPTTATHKILGEAALKAVSNQSSLQPSLVTPS
jgi:thermolabile hemolysin